MIRDYARALWLKLTKTPEQMDREIAWERFRLGLTVLGRHTAEDLQALQRFTVNTKDSEHVDRVTLSLILPRPAVSLEQVRALAIPIYRIKAESSPEYVAWACKETARWLRAVDLTVEEPDQ